MIEVYAHYPCAEDGTSFYRGVGPLNALRKSHRFDLRLTTAGNEIGWPEVHAADVVFIQRPWLPEHAAVAHIAKACGVPVWIDYDDALMCLTSDNPAYERYKSCLANITDACKLAKVITVTTAALKTKLAEYTDTRIEVIPNAWNDLMLPPRDERIHRHGPARIVWRGGASHQRDIAAHAGQIKELAARHPDWQWTFCGWRPWFLDGIKNSHHLQSDLLGWMNGLTQSEFDVAIVPLCSHPFNHCKSNAAWLELTQAACVTVAPDWEEWQQPGILNYDDNFCDVVELAVEERNNDHWQRSQNEIIHTRLLSTVNEQRWQLLQSLI